jgi:SNF2 family DNA or RNA helicase
MKLLEGQIIKAPFLSSVAEVKKFQPREGYYLLEVVLQDENNTYKPMRITEEQLSSISFIEETRLDISDNNEDFFFFIEANRIRLAYQFDPQLAVSVSQVDPLPHQIEAVYHYILDNPRIRFLIADDPGAGKTIMAGLVFKELQYRKLVRRVLIIAPGHLKYQWQREMKERFQTSFAIVDRSRMESSWGENAWEEREHLITSIDFAKQDDIRRTLQGTHWDLIIVDEAHKMSAYAYETKNQAKIDKTKRYQLGEVISRRTEHLLFLTATPHKGDPENFRLFLDLLRPGFFAKPELLEQSIRQKDNPIFIRRLKEDMYDFNGKPIFPPRHVHSVKFKLTFDELSLYNSVTDYVRNYFDKAKENRSISFALMILQRRLTSSSHAIYRSLVKRKERLEELLELPEKIQDSTDYLRAKNISDEELEDMEDEERAKIEEKLLNLTIAKNIDEVKIEIQQLEGLIEQAEEVRSKEIENKLIGLRDHVLANLGDQKLLIFSEFKDTVDYLISKLERWGYEVVTIHGGLNMDARIAAEHAFRDTAQIMVATEAAGEGINLQFCSLMVNYDIPWNPNKLEQRMGRIHRYGQNKEVHIWNMIAQETREGQIMSRLFDKLDAMRKALGSDRVFDIMGEIIPGARLDELIKEALFSQRRIDEIEKNIESIDTSSTQETLNRVFLTGLATRFIDYSGIRKETLLAEENRLVPEYVEDYFLRAYHRLGGEVIKIQERDPGVYKIPRVPYELRQWNNDYNFHIGFGTLFKSYDRITFDKKYAREHSKVQFVAPGHPLLEAVNQQILKRFPTGFDSFSLYGDPEQKKKGILWFVEGEVMDGADSTAGKRVFCLYQPIQGQIQMINPAILWDLEPLTTKQGEIDGLAEIKKLIENRQTIEDHLINKILLPFRDEIAERRQHEAQIKEKYGLRSLDYLIQESNQKILDYQVRESLGESMDLPILNEQRNLDTLKERRKALEREIQLEQELIINQPQFLGAVSVLPIEVLEKKPSEEQQEQQKIKNEAKEKPNRQQEYKILSQDEGVDPERRAEIEDVGMQVAMKYEKEQDWLPEDVSGENHGFDIRSTFYDKDGALVDVRYIEVKARAQTGAIRLSANEWKKARHFDEKYWLYIITNAGLDMPKLTRINNPAKVFEENKDIFATGFIIPEENWQGGD